MHEVENARPTRDYIECFVSAGNHLQGVLKRCGIAYSWLKAEPPLGPCLEHLSFILGNQAFFVRLWDVDERHSFPGTDRGLARIAEGYAGHACVMPMRRVTTGQTNGRPQASEHGFGIHVTNIKREWQPAAPGWGLIDLHTGEAVLPPDFPTDERIPMTDWELYDFAVQVAREQLQKEGKKILSWNSDPEVHPALWFEDGGKQCWAMVQAFRFPEKPPSRPNPELEAHVRERIPPGFPGHFAAVGFMGENGPVVFRGEGSMINYRGLVALE